MSYEIHISFILSHVQLASKYENESSIEFNRQFYCIKCINVGGLHIML